MTKSMIVTGSDAISFLDVHPTENSSSIHQPIAVKSALISWARVMI